MRAYRRNGVQEYLIWLMEDREFRWYELQDGEYVSQQPDASGLIHCHCFPGLCLAVSALLNGNMAEVLAAQQAGLGSVEHQAFVAKSK